MEQKNAAIPCVVNDKCHILRLANELLTKIFRAAISKPWFLDVDLSMYLPDLPYLKYLQFMKLRWVSRTFRFIANESAAWLFATHDLCRFS